MNYLYLIKTLFNYNNYIKYRHHIIIQKDQKEIYYLFKALDTIINELKRDITFEEYSLWVTVNLGKDYDSFLDLIKQQQTGKDLIEKSLEEIKKRNIAYSIAECSLAVSEGKKDFDEIYRILDLAKETKIKESPFVTENLLDIYEHRIKSPGLRWRLQSLNNSLGPLRKGNFGFVFARPESGKTTFFASEATFFAEQTTDENPVLWLNNEQDKEEVKLRIIQAVFGITEEELIKNRDEYNEIYLKNYDKKILLYDNASIHKKVAYSLAKEYNPAIIIIDQLDKIKGFDSERDDLRLGNIYIWARELAKEFAPVIGASQADASAEGKKYLTMENVSNAKTSKQAEADWILGIGKSHEAGFEMIRHLSICKNKLHGDLHTNKSLRHGKFDVLLQQDIARYKDI